MTVYILSTDITGTIPKAWVLLLLVGFCVVVFFGVFFVNWYGSPFWVQETLCVVFPKYPFDSYKMSFLKFLRGWKLGALSLAELQKCFGSAGHMLEAPGAVLGRVRDGL